MNRLRRTLLEFWIILPLACVVGFLGPFGSYLSGDFILRTKRWWILLMGAYVLVRPTMVFWYWIARSTRLPERSVMISGLVVSSFPMALIWHMAGFDEIKPLGGYAGILPFALLCSLAILLVASWADQTDRHLQNHQGRPAAFPSSDGEADTPPAAVTHALGHSQTARPRLYARLSPRFEGDILALESEDHYVRVHGMRQSELLLLRLRDAIAEMDDVPGEQTHRSWWVAQGAVAEVSGTGRNREIRLGSGTTVPVARDSVDRLQRSGFLPTGAALG